MATTLETLAVELVGDSSKFDRMMSGAQSKLDATSKKMKAVGGNLTKSVTLPLVGIGAAATTMATKFNTGMANVASLGLVPERIQELRGNVQEMAVDVGKRTGDLTDGLYQVVSAFGDTADTSTILKTNAMAAAAGLATTTDAINLTSAVTKGYGDTSAEAVQKASDLALQTVKLGQTTFPELASSIGRVTPLASSLGVAQEELFGVLATGTGVTGSAAEVSTQLRGVLQSLMAPTGDMADLLEEMGFESGKALLEQEGLQGAIETVVKAAEDTGKPLQKYIGSIEGQTLATTLAGEQSDTFTEKLAAMQGAAGATEKAFKAQTEGINATGFTMQQAAVKGEVLLQKLGDGLAPALVKLLDIATPWVDKLVMMADWFANADSSTQTWIVTLGAVLAAAGPVITIVGTLIGAVSTIVGVVGAASGAIGGLGAALAVLTGPIGIILLAVAGLAIAWQTDFLGIKTATLGAIDSIKQKWPGWISGMKRGWTDFASSVSQRAQSMWQGVRNFFQSGHQQVNQVTQGQLGAAQNIWQLHFQTVRGVAKAGLQFMRGDWRGGLDTLRNTSQNLLGGIQNIFRSQIDMIQNVFRGVDWGAIGRALVDGIANGIRNGAGRIADAARGAAESAMRSAKRALGIGSPSKVAAKEIGVPTAEGFGIGFEGGMHDVTRSIDAAFGGLMDNMAPEPQMATAGGAPIEQTINIYGDADALTVKRAARDGILDGLRAKGLA